MVALAVAFGFLTNFDPKPGQKAKQVFGLSIIALGGASFVAIGFATRDPDWFTALFGPLFFGAVVFATAGWFQK